MNRTSFGWRIATRSKAPNRSRAQNTMPRPGSQPGVPSGLPVTDAYKLDRRRLDRTLKKLREEDDGAAAEIEASATESGTTQFKGYVPGGDGEDETE